tara:strand:+ start:609 stop:1004 length:396 start_codon:yes stop_codon:yes gene_type:complete
MSYQKYELLSLNMLAETEEHFEERAKGLATEIKTLNMWTVPIVVEINSNAIMDGHHRYNAAKLLGLSRIPCIAFSYLDDNVVLRSWSRDYQVTIDEVLRNIELNKKFPPKTTRHIFKPQINEVNLPLDFLY